MIVVCLVVCLVAEPRLGEAASVELTVLAREWILTVADELTVRLATSTSTIISVRSRCGARVFAKTAILARLVGARQLRYNGTVSLNVGISFCNLTLATYKGGRLFLFPPWFFSDIF